MSVTVKPVILSGGSGTRLWPLSRSLYPKQLLPLVSEQTLHWIVVSGTAKVTRGEETFLVTENQSTYIPLGTKHRLENTGSIPLEMIEVQSGSYLGEDDIVRFEDVYGR